MTTSTKNSAVRVEQKNLTWLRHYTDRIVRRLRTEDFNEIQAVALLEECRRQILTRFPGRERTYQLIYERRFVRLLGKRGIFLPLPGDFYPLAN